MSRATATSFAITASARSFLHHQVRSMVGSLVHVGEGKWSADDLAAALEARDRAALRPGRPAARALSGAGRVLSRTNRPKAIWDRDLQLNICRGATD